MEKVYTKEKILNREINTKYYITGEKYPYFEINEYEDRIWYQNNKIHRLDGPAVIYENENQTWYQNENIHRGNEPAVINGDGNRAWYQNGKWHRVDGPAIIYKDGHRKWYICNIETTKEWINFLRNKYFWKWKGKVIFKTYK